jgi:hypothetical protein
MYIFVLACATSMWSAQQAMLGQQNPQDRRWGLGMAHFEDYELAQSIHRELLELRARANSATSVELSVIAAKAELPTNWQPQERYSGRRTPRAGPDKVIEYKRGSGLLERGVALREGLRSCAPNRPLDVLSPRIVAPRKV